MGWGQYRAIIQTGIDYQREWETTDPTFCPNDGTVLQKDKDGKLHCKFDGWIWSGTNDDKP